MKYGLIALVMSGGLLAAETSLAQPTLQFGIGPNGKPSFGIRDPQQEEWERRERRRHSQQRRALEQEDAYEQGRRDAQREQSLRYGRYQEPDCEIVTVRERNRQGQMVTRRIRRCAY